MARQIESRKKTWYAIHTYSGYEDRVKEELEQRIESLGLGDLIFEVIVPKEKSIEIKNGKRKTVEKKIFPGYVVVQMILTDETWYHVRNTPHVTGFVGSGIHPSPMSEGEIKNLQKRMGQEEPKYKIDVEKGEAVSIIDGPFKGFEGVVDEVDLERGRIKALVSMFGRETSVELDFLQVKKV